ncbi:SURF1 family protein [Aquabacterium sp. A7-Y]|uniref:SURF1 family protein n=1 Tax=Aquabacterium sp. A7-Y TaxID=1349605 RepID=UPI00223D7403|nr:SURF1 family protein [Aquabacterium sp. A7-Y]MCW7539375.1 SURF1 family protein [Aquabacterium sp. A7-Y]
MADTDLRSPRRRGAWVALLLVGALAFAGLVGLGVWQLQRLAWKQDLIERVEQRLRAAPTAAPAPADWARLGKAADEYRRVRLRGRFAHELETLVQASTVLGSGYWVLTPLYVDEGFWVLVNRGFVPPQQREPASRAGQEAAGVQEVAGLLRFSEPEGGLLRRNDVSAGRWYSRDVAAIATARGIGGSQRPGPVAPYFVDAAADGTGLSTAWPRPGLTVLHFSNNHLVYALTWFALAAMVAGAVGYLVLDEHRLRRNAGDPTRVHRRV